jgi:arsenite methyltransferase
VVPSVKIYVSQLNCNRIAHAPRYDGDPARDKLIERLSLKGNESVLDLGCGRGLLLLGAAQKLPQGKAIGVDLWSNIDLSSNSRDAVMNNARLENVVDRIEIFDGDMRKLPFDDASMDGVTASMSIHNIPTREGRREAIKEVARVLKPGGKIALLDFKFTSQYADDCRTFGLANVRRTPISFWNFPPSRTVIGEKSNS